MATISYKTTERKQNTTITCENPMCRQVFNICPGSAKECKLYRAAIPNVYNSKECTKYYFCDRLCYEDTRGVKHSEETIAAIDEDY
jgi:hypothetical protein